MVPVHPETVDVRVVPVVCFWNKINKINFREFVVLLLSPGNILNFFCGHFSSKHVDHIGTPNKNEIPIYQKHQWPWPPWLGLGSATW